MTLAELISAARADVDDTAAPYLCSDVRFTEFANEAQEQAARRGRLLLDSSTTAICQIAVTAGDDFVDLDSRVLFVRRIRVVGQSRPLQKFALADMDQQGTEWEDETGEVMGWIPDMETGKMRLYRKPEEDIALRLTVVRLPLVAMSANSDSPEIKPQYHRALIHWMRYRYYSLQDAEIRDEKKAREALAEFEAQFGPASNALDEAWIHEKHGFDEYEGLR